MSSLTGKTINRIRKERDKQESRKTEKPESEGLSQKARKKLLDVLDNLSPSK